MNRQKLIGLCFIATSLILIPSTGLAQAEPAPDELFKMGNESFNDGKVEKAIEFYQKCVEKRGDFKEAWYNLGIAYGRKKQFDKEIEAYQKAIKAKPEPYTKALYNLAIAHEDKGDDNKAIEYYNKVVKAEPKAVDARINLGILYAKTDRFEKAIDAYKKAIETDPEVTDAYFNLGIAYGKKAAKETDKEAKKGQIKKEIDAYSKATEKNAKNHKAWYNLAIAHNKLGQTKEEIAAYKKAIDAKSEYPQALFNLAYVYEAKDKVKALEYWKKYLTVAESVPSEKKYVATAKKRVENLEASAKSEK